MSRYVYAGEFVNPANTFTVVPNPDGEGYTVAIKVSDSETLRCLLNGEIDAAEASLRQSRGWRPHTSAPVFEEAEDADEWIDGVEQSFDEDYEDYLEENRFEIAQMERYEQWRNEY